jgi:hypothetical protein
LYDPFSPVDKPDPEYEKEILDVTRSNTVTQLRILTLALEKNPDDFIRILRLIAQCSETSISLLGSLGMYGGPKKALHAAIGGAYGDFGEPVINGPYLQQNLQNMLRTQQIAQLTQMAERSAPNGGLPNPAHYEYAMRELRTLIPDFNIPQPIEAAATEIPNPSPVG